MIEIVVDGSSARDLPNVHRSETNVVVLYIGRIPYGFMRMKLKTGFHYLYRLIIHVLISANVIK